MSHPLQEWLRDRLGLDTFQQLAEHKVVPVHRHTVWYYWGGMTLFLFGIQVCTGILLLLYYRASADEAYESVRFLMTDVSFGWLIRSIHSWSANLMIGAALVHMFSVFLLKAYRAPREMTWLSGALLLGLSFAFGFSGYLLPWNQLAFFATKVGTDIAGALPVAGPFMLRFLRGGDQITGGTLTRFFGFHVAILPAMATLFVGLHVYLVQRHGMSVPPSVESAPGPRRTMKFLPDFLMRDVVGWLAALGVLALLCLSGLGYSAVLVPQFNRFSSHISTHVFCIIGLGSVICLIIFLGYLFWYRAVSNRVYEECRRFLRPLLESRINQKSLPAPAVETPNESVALYRIEARPS